MGQIRASTGATIQAVRSKVALSTEMAAVRVPTPSIIPMEARKRRGAISQISWSMRSSPTTEMARRLRHPLQGGARCGQVGRVVQQSGRRRHQALLELRPGAFRGGWHNPALFAYSPQGAVVESCDFQKGRPQGLHVKYSDKGTLTYRTSYVDGLKEGQEEFFSETGQPLGGGLFSKGKPLGKHLQLHPDGSQMRLASYSPSEAGKLLEPIVGVLRKRFGGAQV